VTLLQTYRAPGTVPKLNACKNRATAADTIVNYRGVEMCI
jgi:hypothetical protein